MSFIQMNHIQGMLPKTIYNMLNGRIGNKEILTEGKEMCFSENKDFFESWRFENCPELMDAVECGDIIFFNKEQSQALWSMFVSSHARHLMELDMNIFSRIEQYDVDFDEKESADELFLKFNEISEHPGYVFLFFSEKHLCVTPYYLLQKYWNHYFLPSDETSIVITAKNDYFLFSYEGRFFIVTR
ncbi:hypothetical protein PGO42_06625 [Klebsiella aerogenes]